MMKKLWLCLGLLYSASSFASLPNIALDGTITNKITIHPERLSKTGKDGKQKLATTEKEIVLMRLYLSPQAKAYLAEAVTRQLKLFNEQKTQGKTSRTQACSKVILGMNNAPVLDQGSHGSCVTFATTGALDAVLGMGDYMSQLCNLELGSYLQTQDASYPTGWDGSWAEVVTNQILKYGFINKPSQVLKGCSGYHIYPGSNANDRGNPMPDSEFTQRSEKLPCTVSFGRILGVNEALSPKMKGDAVLESVKNALRMGNRVLIGTITDGNMGNAGAAGKYKTENHSWIITPEIEKDARQGMVYGAHELVIFGYDDNAVIVGKDNSLHKGVITMRNSWGYGAGDWGNTYMSYDYFRTFVFDVVEVKQGACS